MNAKLDNKNIKRMILLCVSVLFIYLLTLLFLNSKSIDDFMFHTKRIIAIANEMEIHGLQVFPYRIYSTQMFGYGYGTPLFYGDIFLYLPAFFVYLGADPIFVSKLVYFSIFIFSWISSYICIKKITNKKDMAIFCSVLYTLSPYLAINVLSRQALGESFAIAIMPMVVMSIYMITHQQNKNKWQQRLILALSMWGLLNTHIISTFITVIALAVYVIYMWLHERNIIYFKNTFMDCFIASLIFMVISASFVLPMLEQLSMLDLRAYSGSDLTEGTFNDFHAIDLLIGNRSIQYIQRTLENLELYTVSKLDGRIGGGMYLPYIFTILIFGYFKIVKKEKVNNVITFCASIMIIFMPAIIIKPITELIIKYMPFIQFTYRLNIIMIVLSFVILIYFMCLCESKWMKYLTSVIIILSSLVVCLPLLSYELTAPIELNDKLYGFIYNQKVGLGSLDYLQNSSIKQDTSKLDVYVNDYNKGTLIENGVITVLYNDQVQKDEEIELPVFYYKGYKAVLDDGTLIDCEDGTHGHAHITVPDDAYVNTIQIFYKGTLIQKISYAISCAGWIGILGYIMSTKRKTKST